MTTTKKSLNKPDLSRKNHERKRGNNPGQTLKDILKIDYDEEFTYKKYISERSEQLLTYLTEPTTSENKYYNIVSPMGSGKTTTILNLAIENNLKMVLLVPLQSIAQQFKNDYKNEIAMIHGRSRDKDEDMDLPNLGNIKKLVDRKNKCVFVCVYDSLHKLLDIDTFIASEYMLVVDEAHNLVTQWNFRNKAINYILDYQDSFKKIINLTGTPEVVLNENNRTILFKPQNPNQEIKITLVKHKEETFASLFRLLISEENKNKMNVVYIDKSSELDKLYIALLRTGVKKDSILRLSSNRKNQDGYLYIRDEAEIDKKYNYVLTTRVISEGISINNKVDNFFFTDFFTDYWLIRQFIARFRNGVVCVYHLCSDKESPTAKWTDFRSDLTKSVGQTQKLINSFMEKFETNAHLTKKYKGGLKQYSEGIQNKLNIRWSDLESTLVVNNNSILYEIIQTFNAKINSNIQSRIEFYTTIAGFSYDIKQFEDLNLKDVNYKELSNLQDMSIRENMDFFKDNFSEILYAFLVKEEHTLIYDRLVLNQLEYSTIKFNTFKDAIRDLIDKKDVENTLYRAVELLALGFNHNLIRDILLLKLDLLREDEINDFTEWLCRIKNNIYFQIVSLDLDIKRLLDYQWFKKNYLHYFEINEVIQKKHITPADKKTLQTIIQNEINVEYKAKKIKLLINSIFKTKRGSNKEIPYFDKILNEIYLKDILKEKIDLKTDDIKSLDIVPLIKLRYDLIELINQCEDVSSIELPLADIKNMIRQSKLIRSESESLSSRAKIISVEQKYINIVNLSID